VVGGDVHALSPLRHEPVDFVLHVGKDGKHEFCVVPEFEAKAMKDQLNNENTFLFSPDGTRLERDSAQAKTFDTERDNAINWIHFWHGDVAGLQSAENDWITKSLERPEPSKPREHRNHEVCCFRWLIFRADYRNKANGTTKVDNAEKEVQKNLSTQRSWRRAPSGNTISSPGTG
jgi:hypothetical protein